MPHKNIIIALLFSFSTSAFATSDFLASASLSIPQKNSKEIFERIISNPRAVMEKVVPELDSSTKVIVPYKVSGSQARPIATMTIKKCILGICKTIALDTAFDVDLVQGNCQLNYVISGDFGRSSSTLTEIYDKMVLGVCFDADSSGAGKLTVDAHLIRASSYSSGLIQKEIFKYLKMQVQPVVSAFQKSI
jgi:hypothetical protein